MAPISGHFSDSRAQHDAPSASQNGPSAHAQLPARRQLGRLVPAPHGGGAMLRFGAQTEGGGGEVGVGAKDRWRRVWGYAACAWRGMAWASRWRLERGRAREGRQSGVKVWPTASANRAARTGHRRALRPELVQEGRTPVSRASRAARLAACGAGRVSEERCGGGCARSAAP